MNRKLLAVAGVAAICAVVNLGSRAAQSKAPRAPFDALLSPASCAQPQWPAEARRYEIEGATTIRFEIGADGKVARPMVAQSSGWRILDEAAVQGIRQCLFQQQTAAARERTAFPLQYVWRLDAAPLARPQLRADSCSAVDGVQAFHQSDTHPSDGDGILLRFLLDGEGAPKRIVAEAAGQSPARVEQAVRYLQSCRFGYDGKYAGERTDTAYGRVVFKQ